MMITVGWWKGRKQPLSDHPSPGTPLHLNLHHEDEDEDGDDDQDQDQDDGGDDDDGGGDVVLKSFCLLGSLHLP